MVELLITVLILVIVLVALFYLIGLIPDPKLQQVAKVVVVVIALIWLIMNIRPLVHSVAN